jgi:hypothetical protein
MTFFVGKLTRQLATGKSRVLRGVKKSNIAQ